MVLGGLSKDAIPGAMPQVRPVPPPSSQHPASCPSRDPKPSLARGQWPEESAQQPREIPWDLRTVVAVTSGSGLMTFVRLSLAAQPSVHHPSAVFLGDALGLLNIYV